jgi:hypothetical protein
VGIAGIFRFDYICSELGRDSRVQEKPLGVLGILNPGPACKRFDDQGNAELLTFPRNSGHPPNFVAVKIGVTASHNQKNDYRVCTQTKRVFGSRHGATAEGSAGNLAVSAKGCCPIQSRDQPRQIVFMDGLGDTPHHAQVEKESVRLTLDESCNLTTRIDGSRYRPEDKRVIESDDQAAPVRPQNTAETV